MRRTLWLLPLVAGCSQLVVFDQAVVGQRDIVPGEETEASAQLCDPEVEMSATAICDESCEIEPDSGETTCSSRVAIDGTRARLDLTALHEVELTLTACAPDAPRVRIQGANGARVDLEGQTLTVRAAEEADAAPYVQPAYLPREGCAERTLVFQTGRMGLADLGGRLCSDHLVPVADAWTLELSRTGLRGVELCLREPRSGG